MAEAHPVGFRWVMKAKERGATVIHVDPRFSRTSAMADLWVPIRAGGDLALLGGLIRHVIENDLYFRDYVVPFTNASVILREDFRDTEDLDGFFSGWLPDERAYDYHTWQYEGGELDRPRRDRSLQHPRCVFQVLRRHYARYTPEMVERIAGVPPELFGKIADAMTSASGPERTAAICYAVGWTQHSKGVQIIRAASILQLLLGNIGRPGGGILALRGHASIQGSTDIPTLYDILPGYLGMPHVGEMLADYEARLGRRSGYWSHYRTFIVSLLRSYYGARATPDNDFGFEWLPCIARNHSHFAFFAEMMDGRLDGLFVMGQNPAVGGQHTRLERKALSKLKWLVVRDLVETETAAFWYDSPEVERGELVTEEIDTEIFLFPAAGHAEKEGSFTQTQRMLQWREKAVEPAADRRSEAWFVHQLALRLKAKAEASDDPRDEPMRALDWWYPESGEGEPVMESVLAEINGWRTLQEGEHGGARGAEEDSADCHEGLVHATDRRGRRHHGPQLESFDQLADDGSTACGCWIYSGVYGPDGVNKALGREPEGRYGHGWGFVWPGDRRILYNRASARPDGTPWSERKALVWWDEAAGRWTGHDRPDFMKDKPPGYRPEAGATGMDAHSGDAPFILHDDGLGWIYAPTGLRDGPLPTHYEPLESPVSNSLYGQATNPAASRMLRPDNPFAETADPRFPHVLTTYRLTEHHTAGGMSRYLSHLMELQPSMFAEISPELAAEAGVRQGGWVTIVTRRGAVEARAMVTRRIRPMTIDGRLIHQVAVPFHWGTAGPLKGDSANDLVPLSAEPNVSIHEGKALTCHVLAGRTPRGPDFVRWLNEYTGGEDARLAGDMNEPSGIPRHGGGHVTEGKGAGDEEDQNGKGAEGGAEPGGRADGDR
jgi:formate dehydrogenase major subunit